MKKTFFYFAVILAILLISASCVEKKDKTMFTGAKGEVKLITIDPGHFHAALILKTMYPQVDPVVHVYAPAGAELEDYMKRVGGYNNRSENPTSWEMKIYTGDDWFEKSLSEQSGNVMVMAGNNAMKTDYILSFIKAGINVLSDKPMVISPAKLPVLLEAFDLAEKNNVLLYDIMTERSEITTITQRELSMIEPVFGTLTDGTPEEPAITKESVHHFFKFVSGNPIVRPPWFFDVEQQGEGIVDVTTHLVDLIQWEAFPDQIIDFNTDIEMINARRWSTDLSPAQFQKVTQLAEYPEVLGKYLDGNILKVFANGEMIYRIRGKYAKASVIWNYEAPEGTGDTHNSVMRGTKTNLIIKQGQEENFKPILYVEARDADAYEAIEKELQSAININLAAQSPGMELVKLREGYWKINIPDIYKVGHEAHFGEVTGRFLEYLKDGKLPEWEVPNMISKYSTIMKAFEMAGK